MHHADGSRVRRESHVRRVECGQFLAERLLVLQQFAARAGGLEERARQFANLRRVALGLRQSRRQRGSAAGGHYLAARLGVRLDFPKSREGHALHIRQDQHGVGNSHLGDGLVVDEVEVEARVQYLRRHVRSHPATGTAADAFPPGLVLRHVIRRGEVRWPRR